MIDETRLAGGLLGRVIFAAGRAAAPVKTQCCIALLENAEPPQYAGSFAQIELTVVLGDHDGAGGEKIRGTKIF
jgi:hypothetical protein